MRSESSRSLAGCERETLKFIARERSVSISRSPLCSEGPERGEMAFVVAAGTLRVGIDRTASAV